MNVDHGNVSIKRDGNMIIVHLSGSFNEFGAKNYTGGVKSSIEKYNGDAFSLVINLLELDGGTPEAFQELERHNLWLNEQNLKAKAMVIKSLATKELISRLSPSTQKQLIQTFEADEDAIQWIKSL